MRAVDGPVEGAMNDALFECDKDYHTLNGSMARSSVETIRYKHFLAVASNSHGDEARDA
jgi:hypothetical protein